MRAAPLARRATAELLGTAVLVTVVVGSGIAAQSLTGDPGLRLLENALATAGGLAVVILVVGPVSGAHLNPVVTLMDWWLGRRSRDGLTGTDVAAYVPAQVVGAVGGAILADAMFDQPLVEWSTRERSGGHLLLGEIVATAGLVVVVVALGRSTSPSRTSATAWAVGAYIGAAYWFTSSTAFANPAATVGRAFTNTFAGIAPASVGGFVGAQLIGGAIGLCLAMALYPDARRVAEELVVPHGGRTEGSR